MTPRKQREEAPIVSGQMDARSGGAWLDPAVKEQVDALIDQVNRLDGSWRESTDQLVREWQRSSQSLKEIVDARGQAVEAALLGQSRQIGALTQAQEKANSKVSQAGSDILQITQGLEFARDTMRDLARVVEAHAARIDSLETTRDEQRGQQKAVQALVGPVKSVVSAAWKPALYFGGVLVTLAMAAWSWAHGGGH